MLQWMGGSRRKITTSRKSVQKRQKQYFESRKRLQQQQHSPCRMHGFGQKNDESRSLDILCMLDSAAPLTGSTFPGEKDGHSNIHASSVCGGAVTHVSAVAIPEAGSPLNCQVDAVCLEKEGIDLHARRENPNIVNVKCPSILDLLGDHPIDGTTEIKPVQEDHVAFSIEGLGTVEAETPNHSPPANNRGINYGGIRCNPTGSPRYKEQKLEFTSWKTLVEDELDNFSFQSCGSEESCTSSAVREKGVGHSPLGKSSKQKAHSRGTSVYTGHGLGPKILPENIEEDEDLDSKLWIHEPLDESFAAPFVAKPWRNKFWDGFTKSSRRRDSKYIPWNSERVAHKQRGILSRQTVTGEEGRVRLLLEHHTRSPSYACVPDDNSGCGACGDLIFEDVVFGVGMSKLPCVSESRNIGSSGLYR